MCNRCDWGQSPEIYREYHDTEWGVPVYDDKKLFEFLLLESAQAGLSWLTILKRREGYRNAFAGFDAEKVAAFDNKKVEELMQNADIIRNRRKIESAINNARAFRKIQDELGSFSHYIWAFVNHAPIINQFKTMAEVPAKTTLSEKISADLKKRGFTFMGPTIVYAHMQATGMVNDHLTGCFRHGELEKTHNT
ncbi:MAG: DNA-3-methyladenine glycosylase I [Prolixibacteraceae bacterium]|nr:DNA-3-methyladenine glycosylase I [Prolixibacteraceae bacterium]MBN2649197.1 DNA-3-methyladenine glycosylase I [Prolixibacteraceae bacterium]